MLFHFFVDFLDKTRFCIPDDIDALLDDVVFLLDVPQWLVYFWKIADHHSFDVDCAYSLQQDIPSVVVSESFNLLLFFIELLFGTPSVRMNPLFLDPHNSGFGQVDLLLQRFQKKMGFLLLIAQLHQPHE